MIPPTLDGRAGHPVQTPSLYLDSPVAWVHFLKWYSSFGFPVQQCQIKERL